MPLQSATPAPAILDDILRQLGLTDNHHAIFLIFFRSDCPWCAMELPRISDVFARHTKLALLPIGIACGHDSSADATTYAHSKGLTFPVLADQDGAIKTTFEIDRVPAIVMIGASGLVERTFVGVTEQLPGILEQALYAAADHSTPPEYDMIGNGCAA